MNFGGYLAEIPKRLGINPALDAAAASLVAAHEDYCLGLEVPRRRTMGMYSRALGAVRTALGNEVQARSSEVLAAVMVLSICQVCVYLIGTRGFCALTEIVDIHAGYFGLCGTFCWSDKDSQE